MSCAARYRRPSWAESWERLRWTWLWTGQVLPDGYNYSNGSYVCLDGWFGTAQADSCQASHRRQRQNGNRVALAVVSKLIAKLRSALQVPRTAGARGSLVFHTLCRSNGVGAISGLYVWCGFVRVRTELSLCGSARHPETCVRAGRAPQVRCHMRSFLEKKAP